MAEVSSQESQRQDAASASDAWGQPISPERQAWLQRILDAWNAPDAGHSKRKGPFHGVRLTGADVSWLAEASGRNQFRGVYNLHLEGAEIGEAHLEGADLYGAHLEDANLYGTHLEGAYLGRAHLEDANLYGAHLESAEIGEAHLEGAKLTEAHLEGAYLGGARLESAEIGDAHLEGADLFRAHLEGANLLGASLDSKTRLNNASLDRKIRLGDIQWGGVGAVNLTQIAWKRVPQLGDEQGVNARSSVTRHEGVVRAYRQLGAQLRAQGMSEVADRFAERAQVRQRKLLFRQLLEDWRRPWRLPGDLLRWLFSWFLALLAGYGYHPGRSVFWYLATIIGFAVLYSHFGIIDGHPFNPVESAVFSLTSFHGRGFFPGGLKLDDPVTVLASVEAVIGLLIEISFIATFTQRFFGAK